MAINAGGVLAYLDLDTGKFSTKLAAAQASLDGFAGKLKGYGGAFQDLGKGLTLGVTAPLAAVGVAAGKSAIDFESAFAGVRKTVDASEAGFKKLETGIKDMSKEIPASATAIAGVAEAAGQLGIETDNILDFTRVMIDLGESTNMSADEAATSLARLANITGMSQTDFDRLGSAIVDLGNNLATTEGEIVAMGLRLAGAGSQIGLTEAQIMSFAGSLSSVGVEAEAGGSAFSRLMVNMQLAVETGNEDLQNFASVASMSAKDFQKAFRDDASGAIIAFIQGLGNAEEKGMSAIKILDDMGITEIRLRDALLRASGASDVFTNSLEMGTRAWEENNALTEEAEQRYRTTASQLQIAKNYLTDAGITIGEIVVPHLVSLAEKVKQVSDWFSKLNPETQETIVKMAGLAAAAGPVLFVGGKMISGLGSIIGLMGKFGPAVKLATTAASTLGGAGGLGKVVTTTTAAGKTLTTLAGGAAGGGGLLGGLTAGLGTSLAAMAPWAIGIGVAGAAAYGLYKHLREDTIPAVDLFSEGVSENTEIAVSSFLDLEREATLALSQLAWSGAEITEEMKIELVGKYDTMKNGIVGKLQEQKADALAEHEEMLSNSTTITDEEKREMMRITEEKYDEMINKTETGNARIKKILEQAKKDNRAITDEERKEIDKIREEMKETAIKLLSETETEANTILTRLKENASKLTAEMAVEVVRNSLEQKEKTIANAEEEYKKRIEYAETLKKEGSKEAEELAQKVIAEAGLQRDEAIKAAEEMHNEVVRHAKEQAEEHVEQIDWESGELKSKWQSLKDWFANNPIIRYIRTAQEGINAEEVAAAQSSIGANAHGTNNWRGGLTWVGEQGPEIIELPKGSKVYSNQKSMEMVKGASEGITQHIHIHSPTPLSPSEIARKNLQASRQLAMEWGV